MFFYLPIEIRNIIWTKARHIRRGYRSGLRRSGLYRRKRRRRRDGSQKSYSQGRRKGFCEKNNEETQNNSSSQTSKKQNKQFYDAHIHYMDTSHESDFGP